jgi:hypothetical protein
MCSYVLKSKGIHGVHEKWLQARDRTLKFEAEVKYTQRQADQTREEYDALLKVEQEAAEKRSKVEKAMAESQRLVKLCESMMTAYTAPEEANKDYYRRQLDEIDADDKVKVEAVMESLIMGVEGRAAKAFRPRHVDIRQHILAELPAFRDTLAVWRRDKDDDDVRSYEERREELVADLMVVVVSELNSVMHEEPDCRRWVMLRGAVV